MSSKYTCLINHHPVLTLKSMFFFKLLFFDFSLKETLTLLTMLVKIIHCKTENDIGKYYHWYSQKNLQKYQQFQIPAVFNFHVWQYWIYSGFSRPKEILLTTNKFPSNGFLEHLWVKINVKLHKKTLAKRDMSIHHLPTVSCVNLLSQSFVLNVLISCYGRFKATKKSSLHISWNYQN